MEILGKHEYIVENNIRLCEGSYESLILLYQPLMGAHAIAIYLLLTKMNHHSDYSQLCLMSTLSIEEIERALIKLEQYQLIRTFVKEEDKTFIHVLQMPLKPLEFLNHYVFGLEYRQNLGNYRYNQLKQKYQKIVIDKTDYIEISEKYKPQNFDQMSDDEILDVVANAEDKTLPQGFNYDLFFNNMTNLLFPHQIRTEENLQIIGELALLYGISEERMKVLVTRSIDHKALTLNVNDLINRVRFEEVVVDENMNAYALPPIAYLQRLQNGAKVTSTDQRLLEKLSRDMKLNNEVINRLIEHVMQTNNNILVANYVLKIAATWKAHDIKTVEQANKVIEMTSKKSRKIKKTPIKRTQEKIIKHKDQELSDEERNHILKRIQEMSEKHEES